MPEAAVHEDSFLSGRKDEVRLSRQIPDVQPVAVSKGKDQLSNGQLRARVLPANARHPLRSLFDGQSVHAGYSRLSPAHQRPRASTYFSAAARTIQASDTFSLL